jgi:hypothetical protein
MGEGDIGDGSIEYFHECSQCDSDGNQPGSPFGLPNGGRSLKGKWPGLGRCSAHMLGTV